jgi:hypothetical protein
MASLAESQATPPLDALAESQPRNPFTDVVAWDPFPPIAFKPDDSVFDREPDPDVSESLRATFRAFAAYANDDGVCWPSDQNVADDLGVWRETVTRHRLRLQEAGWMRVLDKWWSKRTKWQVNVVELLALHLCGVTDLAGKRITRRAHARVKSTVKQVRNRVHRGRRFWDDHTKGGVRAGARGGKCDCRSCREDRGGYVGRTGRSRAATMASGRSRVER